MVTAEDNRPAGFFVSHCSPILSFPANYNYYTIRLYCLQGQIAYQVQKALRLTFFRHLWYNIKTLQLQLFRSDKGDFYMPQAHAQAAAGKKRLFQRRRMEKHRLARRPADGGAAGAALLQHRRPDLHRPPAGGVQPGPDRPWPHLPDHHDHHRLYQPLRGRRRAALLDRPRGRGTSKRPRRSWETPFSCWCWPASS